jgi:type I restriction enzyme M protein
MVGPTDGDIIFDPASGSGWFLIRFFEIVREKIHESADKFSERQISDDVKLISYK